jgi:hypothetical protein
MPFTALSAKMTHLVQTLLSEDVNYRNDATHATRLPMKLSRHLRLLGTILMFSTVASLVPGPGWTTPIAVQRTQVITFHPAIPQGPDHTGYCWTGSIAVDRRGAWRCMEDNSISDPCFEVRGLKKAVVCDANPATNNAGFVMNLTKPLPPPSSGPRVTRPWLLKLADGSVCEIATGTISQVNGVAVPYDCSDSRGCDDHGNCPYMRGLAESLKSGKVWRAQKFTFSAGSGGIKELQREWVEIVSVWK